MNTLLKQNNYIILKTGNQSNLIIKLRDMQKIQSP